MIQRRRKRRYNFDTDDIDIYSDIDTSALVQEVKNKAHLGNVEFFQANSLESKINNLLFENIKVSISKEDVNNFFEGQVNQVLISNQLSMIEDLKKTFINSILSSTGLTAIDIKEIGNIQTSHNMYKGNYVNEKVKYNRNDYKDSSKMNEFRNSQRHDDGHYIDGYTGQRISKNPNGTYKPSKDIWSDLPVEHITSLSDFHKDTGYMIDDIKTKKKRL